MKNEQLIQFLRNGGGAKALEELYSHFRPIEVFITQHGGNSEDARDVFQESLLILYKKAQQPDFQLTASVGTYLYSVCKYIWKDQLKKKNRQLSEGQPTIDIQSTVNNHWEEEARWAKLDRVLQALGDKCKRILQLFYYQKKSMDEIASTMGFKNTNTAKTQKYKCIERAKKQWINMPNNQPL